MAFPKALENSISSSMVSAYLSSSAFAFSAGFLFHVSVLAFRLLCLSSSLPSRSLSPGSGVPSTAPCIMGGGRPPPPPPAPPLRSGVGF